MNRTHAGQTGHRPARKLLSCALISCLALGAAPAFAQSTAATIRGTVRQPSSPDTATSEDAAAQADAAATQATSSADTNKH